MTVEDAVAVFVRGFTFGRSFTHPFVATHVVPGVWVLRDAPRTGGAYRGDEIIAYDIDRHDLGAGDVDAVARRYARSRFTVCVVRDVATEDVGIRAGFKGLGYRLMATEPLMVRALDGADDGPGDARRDALAPPSPPPGLAGDPRLTITRVTTVAEAARLAKAARRRQILPAYLAADPPPMRTYIALDGTAPIGWVSSIGVGQDTWCSNLFVTAPYRRRGIGGALMRRMLADDAAAGCKANVLLASHTGAKLYPTVGYRTIGELLIFTPGRR